MRLLHVQALDVFFDVVGIVHACGDGLSRRRVLGQHFFGRLPFVTVPLAARPFRFFIVACLMSRSIHSLPSDLRDRQLSGLVVLARVSFLRVVPWKCSRRCLYRHSA